MVLIIKKGFKNMNQPLLIAHRGYSQVALENTMAAFKAAAKAGFQAIETDIHLTKDRVFVIHHDEDLSRIYRKDLVISKACHFKIFWSTIFNGYSKRLCTLKDYLKLCRKHQITAVIELKVPFSKVEIEKLLHFVKKDLKKVVFISFYPENLSLLRKCGYIGPMQILSFQPINEPLFDLAMDLNADIDIHHNLATQAVIEKSHGLGITVNVWTVDDKEKATTLMGHGVDMITTNGILASDLAVA